MRKDDPHVEAEGPNRGFSLRGWKESLPRNLATHLSSPPPLPICFGQLFKYISTTKIKILATTNRGISHETQFLSLSSPEYALPAAEWLPFSTLLSISSPGIADFSTPFCNSFLENEFFNWNSWIWSGEVGAINGICGGERENVYFVVEELKQGREWLRAIICEQGRITCVQVHELQYIDTCRWVPRGRKGGAPLSYDVVVDGYSVRLHDGESGRLENGGYVYLIN